MITFTKEVSLAEFDAWSGGRDTLNKIEELDIMEEAESYISDIIEGIIMATGNPPSETEVNDILWFEMDEFFEQYTEEEEE